jgi:hypothetical protein
LFVSILNDLNQSFWAGSIADSQSVKTTEKGAAKVLTEARKSQEENVIYWLILED